LLKLTAIKFPLLCYFINLKNCKLQKKISTFDILKNYRTILLLSVSAMYEACPESKDTSRVGRKGNLLCLLWQHCRRLWSFTCEPCSFDNGRTGFVWV